MNLADSVVVLAQATEEVPSIWSNIDRYGVSIVGIVAIASFTTWLIRFLIKYFVEQIRGWEQRWKDEHDLFLREHDLRLKSEERAEVAVEEARTSRALIEAFKQQTRGGVS